VATPTLVVLVAVALGSVGLLVWLVVVLSRRVTAVAADVQDLQRRLGPTLERLRQDVDVTNRELERVGRTLDRAEADVPTSSPAAGPPPSTEVTPAESLPAVRRRG
jgi:cytoskeletal protein RodZ